jgi:hypothetical protein
MPSLLEELKRLVNVPHRDLGYVNHSYWIALNISFTGDTYDGKAIWEEKGALMPPCANCKASLKWYGVNISKSSLYLLTLILLS